MAKANICQKCNCMDHHDPKCPEMFWPDGAPRGAPPNLPLPAFNPDHEIENKGGESPIGMEFSKIFSGINEKMVRDHITQSRQAFGLEPDDIPI